MQLVGFDDGFDRLDGALTPRMMAVRTTLVATAAELRGDWDELGFLTDTVPLLPNPAEVAWAAVMLTTQNLALVDPAPEPDDIASAGAATASHPHAPAGAAPVASLVLSTTARSLADKRTDLLVTLTASAGPLLCSDDVLARTAASGLFSAVSYAFVRSSLWLGVDPLDKVHVVLASLERPRESKPEA
jgi:hypothetical protein